MILLHGAASFIYLPHRSISQIQHDYLALPLLPKAKSFTPTISARPKTPSATELPCQITVVNHRRQPSNPKHNLPKPLMLDDYLASLFTSISMTQKAATTQPGAQAFLLHPTPSHKPRSAGKLGYVRTVDAEETTTAKHEANS